jgi:hypothetical protein
MNSDIPEIEKAHLQRLAMLLSLGVGFFMLASKMLCTTTRQPTRQARWAVLEGLARRGAEQPWASLQLSLLGRLLPRRFWSYAISRLLIPPADRPRACRAGRSQSYVSNGEMKDGFALIAYPAKYRTSGVMTFIVNQDGSSSKRT